MKFRKETTDVGNVFVCLFFFILQSTETQDSSRLRCVGDGAATKRYKAKGRGAVIKEMRKRREPK